MKMSNEFGVKSQVEFSVGSEVLVVGGVREVVGVVDGVVATSVEGVFGVQVRVDVMGGADVSHDLEVGSVVEVVVDRKRVRSRVERSRGSVVVVVPVDQVVVRGFVGVSEVVGVVVGVVPAVVPVKVAQAHNHAVPTPSRVVATNGATLQKEGGAPCFVPGGSV